jgi:putative phage-type endonuclease
MNTEKQRTKEWFEQRKWRITASSVGAILGVDPYRTPADVLRAMVRDMHGAEREFTGNIATEYGTFHEEGARIELAMELGQEVQKAGFVVSEEHPWLGASPDGFVNDQFVVEIKCPYSLRTGEGEHKTCLEQPQYYAQVQVQLIVTGRPAAIFYQWAPHKTKIEIIVRDREWENENLWKLRQFWLDAMEERDNPAHLEPLRVEIETPEADALMQKYHEVCRQLNKLEVEKKEIIEQVAKMAGERDAVVCGYKLTKVVREGPVNYSKIVKDNLPQIDVEPYRGKGSEYWRLQ